MSEITTGLRRILSRPLIYDSLQALLGGTSARKQVIEEYVRPREGMRMLDIGCGTADILSLLPEDMDYIGFDASAEYIRHARHRYGKRAHFYQEYVNSAALQDIGQVDLVMASGLLHHLSDQEALQLTRLAHRALRSGGRFITVDPALEKNQSPIARFLIRRDRGQNIRSSVGYEQLISDGLDWESLRADVRNDLLLIPYTHVIIVCTK